LDLVPPLDARARSSTWIAPVTAFELAAAAMVFWVAGWLVYTFSSRARRVAMSLVALGVVSAALGAYLQHRYNEPVGLITSPNVPVLEAPYGTADATTRLEEGTAVRIVDEAGPWLRISRGVSQGWVLTTQVWRL
jgi:membrane associated rhomboid family serine protease